MVVGLSDKKSRSRSLASLRISGAASCITQHGHSQHRNVLPPSTHLRFKETPLFPSLHRTFVSLAHLLLIQDGRIGKQVCMLEHFGSVLGFLAGGVGGEEDEKDGNGRDDVPFDLLLFLFPSENSPPTFFF